jgi:hypothetical protein
MTTVRKLALKISNAVVRFASPGSKEWAQGLAREVAFIENDWSALGWVISSTRVLLDRRKEQIGAPSENSSKWPRPVNWSVWLALFMISFNDCIDLLKATYWQQRMGAGLAAFCWAYWTAASILKWRRERNAPPLGDVQATRLFQREGLERSLERSRSIRRWFPTFVTVAFCSHFVLTYESVRPVLTGVVIAAAFFAIVLASSLNSPKQIQEQIERLDTLIAGGS